MVSPCEVSVIQILNDRDFAWFYLFLMISQKTTKRLEFWGDQYQEWKGF